MSKKVFKTYAYDISLDEGAGAQLVSWVTGLMVFFVTLTLAFNFGLASVTRHWVTGLEGTLTVEIKPPLSAGDGKIPDAEQKRFDNSVAEVLGLLRKSAAVNEARALSADEIKSLIKPWIGDESALDALPLPALIDIKLKPAADATKLQEDIRTIAPGASVDTHADTLDDVRALVRAAALFLLALTGVITALAVVTISGIVRAKLMIHQSEVETLHLIGASDEYIARQFRRHTLRGTLRGALGGVVATLVVLVAAAAFSRSLSGGLFPPLRLTVLEWTSLFVLPIVAGSMIAHIAAQAAALRELSKLP